MVKPYTGGPGPLAQRVTASGVRQQMDRARDAAPLALEQISRRLRRAITTPQGTPRRNVTGENAELFLRAARELREGVTDLSSGDLMVKDTWQKLDAKTKQAYLDYIRENQPGNTPEVRRANGEAALEMYTSVMESPMPEGVDLTQQEAPDRFVPAVYGGRKMVALGSEEAENRSRNAIPVEKRASSIIGTEDATKMRKSVADPAPVNRKGALPSEVAQQKFTVDRKIQEGGVPVTRLTTEADFKRQARETGSDLRRSRSIPKLQRDLAELMDADIEGRARFLGGTEPGLDVVPGEYASAGQVPVAPIDDAQQTRTSMRELDSEGDQVFVTQDDPAMSDLTPQQRRRYIQGMDPMPPMTPEQLAPAIQAAQAQMPLLAGQIPGNLDLLLGRSGQGVPGLQGAVRSEMSPTQLNLDMLTPDILGGQPDAPGVRLEEGLTPARLSGNPKIASLLADIKRLETPGADKFLAEKLARIESRLRPKATSNEFLVKPFGEDFNDSYNVMKFSDEALARFNRYVMQMLEIPEEALSGNRAEVAGNIDPSSAKAIASRAMERSGEFMARRGPQRREVVPFDLDFALPELTRTGMEMKLKAGDLYTAENLAYLISDKMKLLPEQFDVVASQLIPRIQTAMDARDEARRLVASPRVASGLPAATADPPPLFGEMVPRQQQLDEYRIRENTDLPLFAPMANPFEPQPGFDLGNVGAYADRSRPQSEGGFVARLSRDQKVLLDERLIAMADEALQGGEGNIESIGPNQYGVFLPESQTPIRTINAEEIASGIIQEQGSLDVSSANDANSALDQLTAEMREIDFGDGGLAEPAGPLEDLSTQSVVESAPTDFGVLNSIFNEDAELSGSVDNVGDLVGTVGDTEELAPAAPPLGDAPSAAEVAQALANDGVLSFVQPPATATVSEAMSQIAGNATPEARSAVDQLVAAGAPIDAETVAKATGSPTDVIRALAAPSAPVGKPIKLLEAERRGLQTQRAQARKRNDEQAVARFTTELAAKDVEILQATVPTSAVPRPARRGATPAPAPTDALVPAAAPIVDSADPAITPTQVTQVRGGVGQTATPPAPTPAAPTQLTLEQYRSLGQQLGFAEPPSQDMTPMFGDELMDALQDMPTLEPANPFVGSGMDLTSLFGSSAPPTPPVPKTLRNLPSRVGQYARRNPGYTMGLATAGTIGALGLSAAGKRDPKGQTMELSNEEQRLLQEYDARRNADPFASGNPQETLNPQQSGRSSDRVRSLLQSRP